MEPFPAVLLYIPLTIMCAILVCNIDIAKGLDLTEVNVLCNYFSYVSPSDREYNLMQVFGDIIELTPSRGFHYCANNPIKDNGAAFYCCGACNGHLSKGDCNHCLAILVNNLKSQCPRRFGATGELRDCRVRYEIYNFAF